MIVVTSIFVAEIKGFQNTEELLDEQMLPANDKNALQDARELISLYEGKNRVEPIE